MAARPDKRKEIPELVSLGFKKIVFFQWARHCMRCGRSKPVRAKKMVSFGFSRVFSGFLMLFLCFFNVWPC